MKDEDFEELTKLSDRIPEPDRLEMMILAEAAYVLWHTHPSISLHLVWLLMWRAAQKSTEDEYYAVHEKAQAMWAGEHGG